MTRVSLAVIAIWIFAIAGLVESSSAQPPWMQRGGDDGGERGGDRGGRSRGGGDRGGFGGGGFGGGGFDPSGFLNRLDSNGNGSIDPDEMQGPAKFFLDRMARSNPKIDLSKPIPLKTITDEFQRMRGGGPSDDSSSDNDSSDPERAALVMGFGRESELEPIPGFGADADFFSVKVLEEDIKESAERMRRYDRNGDGSLDEDELARGRWSGNPMQYDRNGDKKLSVNELSVRYAQRRLSRNDEESNDRSQESRSRYSGGWGGSRRDEGRDESESKKSLWEDRASYRITPRVGKDADVKGLPNWFVSADANGDGQVVMREFASNWDESVLDDFFGFDRNKDGVITTEEVLRATEDGVLRGGAGTSRSSDRSSTTTSVSSGVEGSAFSRDGLPSDDERWVSWCEKKLVKMDANSNGAISINEWEASLGDFNEIDSDQDGNISLLEYYRHRKR